MASRSRARREDRRSNPPASFNPTPLPHSPPSSNSNSPSPTHLTKLSLTTRDLRTSFTSTRRHETSISPITLDQDPVIAHSRSTSTRSRTRDMASSASGPLSPLSLSLSAKPPTSTHAKLHKRATSNSLPGPPSPLVKGAFRTPFATYENGEPFSPHAITPPLVSSAPKIKPYLRKMSGAKEDQGTIDLSKSLAENERLAGLGIQDLMTTSASDVNFAHTSRRGAHGRTTSVGSQVSNGSSTLKPGQTFTHPMTKIPRPSTPPSYAPSADDESEDIVDDDFRLGAGFRTKRSMSISSTPQTNPTPLSQSHTASELGLVPKLTSTSQSNLSVKSDSSGKHRSRRGTDISDLAISPSARPSFDKALSFVSGRRHSTDILSREDQIREARRKFEEKEARKDDRHQKEAAKRRESEEAKAAKRMEKLRKSSTQSDSTALRSALRHVASDRSGEKKQRKASTASARAGAESDEHTYGRSYETYRPAHAASLPQYGTSPGESEKMPYSTSSRPAPRRSERSWLRFSTWLQTRMLSCGRTRH